MNDRPKSSNAWNKNQPTNKTRNRKGTPLRSPSSSSDLKFKEAHEKLQQSIQKHVKAYESSSEEEEVTELETVIDGILKNYAKSGGTDDSLGRTKSFLEDSFRSGVAVCLICISRVKRENSVWSCSVCFCVFHLNCIQRWSKDCIFQQKQIIEGPVQVKRPSLSWSCPKCRHNYHPEDVPDKYFCFCKKTVDPKFEPFLAPHSCGEICKKDLQPYCGHKCLLLCHPGPCPPCPVTVSVSCYCASQPPRIQRCSNKEWSCKNRCGKLLQCGKHTCSDPCHGGDCNPCAKKSLQKCVCKSEQKLRDCSSPIWKCEKVCNKPLDCGNHNCDIACHDGDCEPCPLSKPRTCPCGKSKHELLCTEETPTCLNTCNKLLECGQHNCNKRCHKDACGVCLEIVEKSCRCGQHSKEIQCYKPYLCESKCKRMKDCNKHPCNRKCCDGNCPPCEKPCGRTLNCGNHKCASVCHRGMCYPCNQTENVSCRCGSTKIEVSCGRKSKTKPPKCQELCLIPPDCHHAKRTDHRCHFGDCPPCRQVCKKARSTCAHSCSSPCHSAVLVKVEGQKASMPWEQQKPQIEMKDLPCPNCVVPIPVTCLGGHETSDWPCFQATPSSCQRPCGRLLLCENHTCALNCHTVEEAPDEIKAGKNCETCESFCAKERPEGCEHECPKPCHPGPCPPCKQMLRVRCHCGLNQPYVACNDWLDQEKREELQSCGNQCPKNFDCGHRCKANCHSGPCPNPEFCKKKVKVTCKCRRLKKEFSCESVRKDAAKVECDEICEAKKEEERKQRETMSEQKKKEEELRNLKELEKYQKMFEKKKSKERRVRDEKEQVGWLKKYQLIIALTVVLGAVGAFFLVQT